MTDSQSDRNAPTSDIAELVSNHHRELYGYAYRLTGSAADAEDLTQQTFLIAQRKISQLREAGSARSWLYTVLRNHFLKECRRKQPVAESTLDVPLEEFSESQWDDSSIDEERLQMALDALPQEYRLVVSMFYFEDLSYKEIAHQLEIPLGTVMSRLSRAKQQLRKQLATDDALRGE